MDHANVPSAMDEPIRITFTMYRQSWDALPVFTERHFGAVYCEYIEEYELSSPEVSLTGPMRLSLAEKHGTGRRFELLESMTLEQFLRDVPTVAEQLMDAPYVTWVPADGRLVVLNPASREVLLMRELV